MEETPREERLQEIQRRKEEVLTDPYAKIDKKLHLLLRTGQLLMESGADSDRTVRDMTRAAAFMGIPKEKLHLHVMYTTLMLNVNDQDHTYTEFRKCRKHGVNMETLTAVSHLTWRALRESFSLRQYEALLERIAARPRTYSFYVTALSAGLACGGFSKLFGGSWLDFVFTAVCAFFGFFVRRLCIERYGFHPYAGIAIASFAATMLAWSVQFITGNGMAWYPLIACALFIVPGIPLINAVDDLLNGFIVSGMARFMHTLLIVGSMTFGIVIAIRLGNIADFTAVSMQPDNVYLSQVIAAGISAMCFSVIFNLPKHLLPVVGIGGIIAVMTRNIMVLELGFSQIAGSFTGAVLVSVIALRMMHVLHVPIITLTIPSVIPMIPGVLLYRLLFAVLNIQTISSTALLDGIRSGTIALFIIIGIAIGITIPNIFISRRLNRERNEKTNELLEQRFNSEA